MQKLSNMMNDTEKSYDWSIDEVLQKERDRYNARKLPQTDVIDCERCGNKGMYMVEENGYNVLAKCNCYSIRESDLNKNRSALAMVQDKFTFDKWKITDEVSKIVYDTALDYVNNYDGESWFYVGGQVGSGKSHICSAIIFKLMEQSHVGSYHRWHEIIKELKAIMNTKEYNERMHYYKTTNLLYIDDFLKNASESDMNIAFEIIQGRVDRSKSTIISSEKFLQEITDEAISSRIKQMCGKYLVHIGRNSSRNFRTKE